jgi:hypothetical protein
MHAQTTLQLAKMDESEPNFPRPPRNVDETGLSFPFLVELTTKALFIRGQSRLSELSRQLKLAPTLLETLLGFMRTERICEVAKRGDTDGDVQYQLTDGGRARASEFLQKSQYAGAAPVSLADYSRQIQRQAIGGMRVEHADLDNAFDGLVIKTHLREQLGAAMNSGRAMFLYGPAGSGKTYLAEQLARLLSGDVVIPHAIVVDDQVIQLFDPLVHQPVEEENVPAERLDRNQRIDPRWVLCRRPVALTGGELTMDMLDLDFDATTRFYQAPPHVKANNGIFIVDDLGRQVISPRQLMNRWIVPMDRRRDYLKLHNGYKFVIPFDVILVFSTNMKPSEVADEAFLRRLGYKIHVGPMEETEYRAIFKTVCEEQEVPFTEAAIDYLIHDLHQREQRPLLACNPRDIVCQVKDFATYRGVQPEMNRTELDWAWRNYFASH